MKMKGNIFIPHEKLAKYFRTPLLHKHQSFQKGEKVLNCRVTDRYMQAMKINTCTLISNDMQTYLSS